ncbi:MAG: MoxR family ATPase [Oscillospiraceae bacterium]|nr:MoxR family ATPase [Oscillospiraceae bacterium]MBQ4486017.1 MoxR family ATPase [Oscillospiraceae bacterium]
MERPGNRNEKIDALINNVEKVIIGKRRAIELVITSMLTGGHILIEDVPGVGKTRLVSALARSCDAVFGRLQMTPDIMPTDITGFTLIDPGDHSKSFQKGAAFCNFLLADEINRASPKSQSALLEIMEEGQVSIDGNTYILPVPFMVLATQNPVETYGTYHLPEAQMDRFLMKISMGYPSEKDETEILDINERHRSSTHLDPVITCDDITALAESTVSVKCTEAIKTYIVQIAEKTRNSDYIRLGVSPRGSISLFRAAKAYAMISGRDYVIPDDVKFLSKYVLAHRIILTPKGKSACGSQENAIEKILDEVQVPV